MEKGIRQNLKLLIACLIACFALIASSCVVFGATSGDCGDTEGTVSFEIDADGVMTISGTGSIKQQTKASAYAWYADRTKVKKLVLEEGITNAPNSAFNGMSNLKDVELPSTLATWGTNVFASSSNIETIRVTEGGSFFAENNILYGANKTRLVMSGKKVTGKVEFPKTLKTIDAYGLDGRGDITEIVMPEGLETIGNYAFRNVKKPETLTIPSSVTSIGTNAFQNWELITEVTVPDGVKTLSSYTFSGCSELKKAILPDDLNSIGTYAFQNCKKLNDITIPKGVTKIDTGTFTGCEALEELVLPENLITVGLNAFSGCSSLKKMTIPDGVKMLGASATSSGVFQNCTALEEVTLPEGLEVIGASAFKGCTSLESITIPDSVLTIGGLAFQQCTALTEVTVPSKVKELTGTFAGCTSLKKVNLPENLNSLKTGGTAGSQVGPFTGCEALEEIRIPAGVTSIPKDAFNGCASLTSLGLTDGVTSIGQSAYMNCTSLEDITIPKTVVTVMGSAFENCTNLTRVRLAEGMEQFNTNNKSATTAFKGCSRLTDLFLPDSLEGFNPITFEQADNIQQIHVSDEGKLTVQDRVLYNKDLTTLLYIPASYAGKLVLPETVVETGSRVAGFTGALTEIVFPEGFKTIGDSAFYYANGLKKVTLPESLETIGASGFRATGLESIEIPDNVTNVGTNAFTLCENLKSAKIGSGLTSIPNAMFFNCNKLSELILPEEITSISLQAFSGTRIPEIVVPDGCKTVGATAFANNSNLNQVILPDSLTSIPSTAFNNDPALKYIYYKGTADQWAALKCTPAYGTVITDYKGVNTEIAPAVIAKQPIGGVYEKDAAPAALEVTVTPKGEEGEQYFYTWYKNTDGRAEGGTTVAAEAIENGSSCVPTTDRIGTEYYYCVIVRMVNGYASERVVSDVAQVTVKMQMEGSGSELDPFLISGAGDLETLYTMVKEGNSLAGVYLKMTEDIELPADWDPIGVLKEGETASAQGKNVLPFSGVFDGGGHKITVPEGGKPLFGYVRCATIRNLDIYGIRIEGTGLIDHYERDYETGSSQSEFGTNSKYIVTIENVTLKSGTRTRESGLVGENNESQDASSQNPVMIISCKAESGVEIGYDHDEDQIGTFAGRICGTIINCESSADVYGKDRVGGIAGCQDVAMGVLHVINSSFHGAVHASGNFAGGILGSGYRGSAPNALCVEITNCFSDGSISGADYVGGIFGAEDEVAQCWGNGIGNINNNLFTGTLEAGAGAKYVGGIAGFYRSLNKYTNFSNNYFRSGCGASRWLGGAQFIDTSADHETESDITYINTEKSAANCPYVQFCDWKQGLNRTDDPFGADANALGAPASEDELKSGEVLKKLNEGDSSMKNWNAGENGFPCISNEAVCYELTLSGEYKTEYYIGDALDTSGMKLTAKWTDGKVTEPAITDEAVTIDGFDSEIRGFKRLVISYGGAKTECTVKVLVKGSGEDDKITVSFTLLGDRIHDPEETDLHTMKMGTLETWIGKTEYQVDLNATVRDLLVQALGDQYEISGTESYISGIKPAGGSILMEKANGNDSGWMYMLNGEHVQNMVNEQFLEDGDEVVFHYTDNFHLEEDDLDATAVKQLITEIDALPAPENVKADDAENVWTSADSFAGLEDDLDQLVPSALKQKLNTLNGTVTPLAAEARKQQYLEDKTNAENALAKAQASSQAAEKAAAEGRTDALQLAKQAQQDAKDAVAKAELAEKSAQKTLTAMQRMQILAEVSGDNAVIAEAKESVAEAQGNLDDCTAAKESVQTVKEKADGTVDKVKTDQANAKKAAQAEAKATKAKMKAAKKKTVKKLKVNVKKRKATLTWKRTKGVTGYQVQFKLAGKKWKNLKSFTKKTNVTSKKLKKGMKCAFRVRTVTLIKGKLCYGKWTKAKVIKVR